MAGLTAAASRLQTFRARTRRAIRAVRREPHILRESGTLAVGSSQFTFVVVCGPAFDQDIPTAGTTSRLGWCSGFEEIGIPFVLLSTRRLASRLPLIPNPICLVAASDYAYLDDPAVACLQLTRQLVWVDTWFRGEEEFREQHNFPKNTVSRAMRERVLSSSPGLLFTISPESSFEFYELWMNQGTPLVSLPLACDTRRYRLCPTRRPEFEGIQIAFVGGYWPYKAQQLDRYLRPYQNRLTVFGYSPWPYAGYGGLLADELESSLYHQARLSPCINEPHVEVMGVDLNERVFKVLGSGGVAITDAVPGYREWFGEEELLVPRSPQEFREFVELLLNDEAVREQYKQRGSAAVYARHTYAHRARKVMSLLKLDAGS